MYSTLLSGILLVCGYLLGSNTFVESSLLSEPVGFECNLGQVRDFNGASIENVLCYARFPGYGIFITQRGISFVFYQEANFAIWRGAFLKRDSVKVYYARVDFELVNSKISSTAIEYSDPIPGYANYYLPQQPAGILGVIAYKRVRINEIYPGIDWVWKIEKGKVHHEFEIKKGDISALKIRVKWGDVRINDKKKLIISTPFVKIVDGDIFAYESANGIPIDISYKLSSDNIISFDIKNYFRKNGVIIDPPLALVWGTYYGGSGSEAGFSSATDADGNVFVVGRSNSTNFPTHNPGGGTYFQGDCAGAFDCFILKFNNAGVREWATYYGGNAYDAAQGVITDEMGNVFIVGTTESNDFPTYDPGGAYYQSTNAGMYDVFILKFTNLGARLWATYYGGSDYDYGGAADAGPPITTDGFGNIFVVGTTMSVDFPIQDPGGGAYFQDTYGGGYTDGYILKFNNAGVRQWATYYGGSGSENCLGIDTDGDDNLLITGITRSIDFPTYNPGGGAYYQGQNAGLDDVFLLKFNNAGVRVWATYYGGSFYDYGFSIITDNARNVFVTGSTRSADFPTYDPGGGTYYQGQIGGPGGLDDAFILKFNNTGVRQWATYYGGWNIDYGSAINVDDSGNVFVAGRTSSTDFPTQDPGGGAYFQDTYGGGYTDGYILKFNNAGVRQWATYYGGSADDVASSISIDRIGNIFAIGRSSSVDLPTQNPGGGVYYQATNAGSNDIFILKFESAVVGIAEITYWAYSPIKVATFFRDKLILNFPELPFLPIKITLYNSIGQIIYSKCFSSTSPVEISDERFKKLNEGIYFLEISSGNKLIRRLKLIHL